MDNYMRRGDGYNDMFYQRGVVSHHLPFRSIRDSDPRLYSLLQRSQSCQQPLEFNNRFRHQEWAFTKQTGARIGSMSEQGQAKGLIHDMVFRKDVKPTSTSHLFDVRDAISGHGDSGSLNGRFRDQERRWQVSNMIGNHQMHGKVNGGFDWNIASSSRAFSKDASPSFGWQGRSNYNGISKLHSTLTDPIVINDGTRYQLHTPFQLELQKQHMLHKSKFNEIFGRRESQLPDTKKMRMSTQENDLMPNLKLGLSPGSVDDGAAKKCLETDQEADSILSLSLSPPNPLLRQSGVHSFTRPRETDKSPATIEFLETGRRKAAALGLSTLDLTMSIKALE